MKTINHSKLKKGILIWRWGVSKNLNFSDVINEQPLKSCPIILCRNFRAGYKLTVIDNTDKDWWKGKCVGSVGVFPSTYVTKLQSGEKPLQVIQSVTINSAIGDGPIQLLRDQASSFKSKFSKIAIF